MDVETLNSQGVFCKEDVLFVMLLYLVQDSLSRKSELFDVEESIKQYKDSYDCLPYSHQLDGD